MSISCPKYMLSTERKGKGNGNTRDLIKADRCPVLFYSEQEQRGGEQLARVSYYLLSESTCILASANAAAEPPGTWPVERSKNSQ